MAVERRELGVVDDGLAVYKSLIETYLDEQARLQDQSELPNVIPLSREWDRLIRDLYGIVDSVAASPSLTLWIDTLSWVMTVVESCAKRGVINAMASVFGLIEAAWYQELASPGQDPTRQDALLLRLSEFGMVRRARSRERSGPERAIEISYTRTFLHVIKQAIESGDVELAKVSVQYFVYGNLGPTDDKNPVADAGLLMIYAWILYRFDRDDQPELFNTVLHEISSSFDNASTYYPTLRTADALENELGVHWWEMRGRGPTTGGMIEIGSYITLALILIGGAHLQFEQLDAAKEEDGQTAQRILSVLDSMEKGGFAKALSAAHGAARDFSSLKSHLTSIIQASDLAREESYAKLPLDAEHVATFRRAVETALVRERTESLAAALRTDPLASNELPEANFGLDRLFPRSYFAKTRVYADPQRLAEELVRGLGRGEEERILKLAIGELDEVAETAIEDLTQRVDASVAQSDTHCVVVTNSYRAHAMLTGRMIGVNEESENGLTEDVRVVRVHDDRPPYVAVLNPLGQPTVHVSTPASEITGDERLEDGRAIVGVSELPDDEMNRIIGEKDRTALDEARLRGSVRVRLLEHLKISIDEGRAPLRWRLPEGTW